MMEGLGRYKNVLAALVIIVVFAFGAKKIFEDYQLKGRKLQEYKQIIDKGRESMERWQKASGEYNTIAAKFFQQDPALFKRFVEDAAQSSNVMISSSSITKEEKGQFLYVKLSMKSQASYRNLTRFIKAVEAKTVKFEQLMIQKSGNRNTEQDIVIQGFVLK
ncbi:MAG: hypothetical protein ABH865_07775 [Candidatus Omnitrophota bacterium]|nr:hypothetical protein [Candidatus Omnitrophota bacterium]